MAILVHRDDSSIREDSPLADAAASAIARVPFVKIAVRIPCALSERRAGTASEKRRAAGKRQARPF